MKKINPIGNIYGKLTVISEHSKTRNHHYRYTCICECGKTVNVLLTHLRQGNIKSCGCAVPKKSERKQWTGVGDISGAFWYDHIIRSANGSKGRREIEVTITKEYAWDLFLKQESKCALSGLKLSFPSKNKDKSWTASLDRIDSSKGYVEGNVQWVHKDVNIMKNKFDHNYFIEVCKLISNHAGGACEVK